MQKSWKKIWIMHWRRLMMQLSHKEERDQWVDLQEHMDKQILKVSTLNISTCLNTQQLKEENDEVLNAVEDNAAT